MPMIRANGVDFHYLQTGDGPDLVMLHGLAGNLAMWHLRIVPRLRDRFRVTTYDLRGHGRSGMPPTGYTTRDMAHDLVAILDELQIEDAHLAGHSYGADTAMHTALLFPDRVRTLTLIEPGMPALLLDRQRPDWEGWANWAEILERLSGQPVPPERRSDAIYMLRRTIELPIVYGPARGRPRRNDRILRLMDETTLAADYEVVAELTLDNVARIDHPKLIMCDGGSAWLATYHELRARMHNCRSVLLPASELRHFAPLDAPELLVEHLVAFLGEAPAASDDSAIPATVSDAITPPAC